jgi:hypothetical protein
LAALKLSARSIAIAFLFALVLCCLTSCAGTTTVVGLTTNQDAYAEEKNPR